VCEAERRPEFVRDELLVRCRAERIEPPVAGRIDRVVRSALHQAEQTLIARVAARLPVDVADRSVPWSRSACRTTTPARTRC
jgi:hypothetical protein